MQDRVLTVGSHNNISWQTRVNMSHMLWVVAFWFTFTAVRQAFECTTLCNAWLLVPLTCYYNNCACNFLHLHNNMTRKCRPFRGWAFASQHRNINAHPNKQVSDLLYCCSTNFQTMQLKMSTSNWLSLNYRIFWLVAWL